MKVDTGWRPRRNGMLGYSGVGIQADPSFFETDMSRTSHFRLRAITYVRFHNKDKVVGRIDSVTGVWELANGEVIDLEIESLLDGHPRKVNGLRIEPRQKTEEYVLICDGKIELDKKSATVGSHLRLTMRADDQRDYCVSLTADWEQAWCPQMRLPVSIEQAGDCE